MSTSWKDYLEWGSRDNEGSKEESVSTDGINKRMRKGVAGKY